MSFFARVFNHLVNEVLVNSLANKYVPVVFPFYHLPS